MRRFSLVTGVCFLALLATDLQAASPPMVELDPGFNEVLVSVVNNSGRDLKGLRVTVDRRWLPSWLQVMEISERVSLVQGQENLRRS
ncbi:MAG TPA: hypothetical protein EYP53_00865 [Candidatus Latescibacteria bacterium]|nr:hypothetical protein [Candidatus Latescibacterota bacterium]